MKEKPLKKKKKGRSKKEKCLHNSHGKEFSFIFALWFVHQQIPLRNYQIMAWVLKLLIFQGCLSPPFIYVHISCLFDFQRILSRSDAPFS